MSHKDLKACWQMRAKSSRQTCCTCGAKNDVGGYRVHKTFGCSEIKRSQLFLLLLCKKCVKKKNKCFTKKLSKDLRVKYSGKCKCQVSV